MLLQIEPPSVLLIAFMFQYIWVQNHLYHSNKHTNDKSSQTTCIDRLQKINNILIAGEQRKPNQNISLAFKVCQLLFDGMEFIQEHQDEVSFIRPSTYSRRMRDTKKVKKQSKKPPQKQNPNKTQNN